MVLSLSMYKETIPPVSKITRRFTNWEIFCVSLDCRHERIYSDVASECGSPPNFIPWFIDSLDYQT
jgi:hypothetical protein